MPLTIYDELADENQFVNANYPVPVSFGLSNRDAFGRMRVASPHTIFDCKQLHDNAPLLFDDQEVSGSGTGSTHSTVTASSVLTVSDNTAGKRVRQSYQRFLYQPGKSNDFNISITPVLSGGGSGLSFRGGAFDDSNGVFFQVVDGVPQFVLRSSASGSPVDTAVSQAAWNNKTLLTSADAGTPLDVTKSQILYFDYEWLGVGTARCGFVINGEIFYCHLFHNANLNSGVYMSTPHLPIRYEIENDGTGAASSLEAICCTVMSNGGLEPLGVPNGVSTGGTAITASSAGTLYAALGVRQKSDRLDSVIDMRSLSLLATTNDDLEWVLLFNPTVTGTPSWTDGSNSDCQYAVGDGSITLSGGHRLDGGYVAANSGAISPAETYLRLGSALDGTRDQIWLAARSLTPNASILATLDWLEHR